MRVRSGTALPAPRGRGILREGAVPSLSPLSVLPRIILALSLSFRLLLPHHLAPSLYSFRVFFSSSSALVSPPVRPLTCRGRARKERDEEGREGILFPKASGITTKKDAIFEASSPKGCFRTVFEFLAKLEKHIPVCLPTGRQCVFLRTKRVRKKMI